MEDGYIVVYVSSAREARPLAAARVEIRQQGVLLGRLATDASGKTDRIALPAPDRALSLDENYMGRPYSTCDIAVSTANYSVKTILGVQVFAGVTSILPVAMEPLILENGFDPAEFNDPVVRDIGDHTLNDCCEWSSGPTPGRILERVVLPEYITVHLGRPDQSARNETVSFPYYIKNVCSSEIYPTWPESAIRANIHCQVSLALNRYFTEWYRSRGYPFDITNSTQYDQYYVSGRNIYSNISNIVDEIFNIYIHKGNNLEPFYAEYCNGSTVTCPGLKQWGTVTLAQDGYSPINILRYYYGNDVELISAEPVEGAASSYGGTPLTVGSRGAAVSTIQTQLLRIRQNYPLIPDLGTADGTFGARTLAAVLQFQKTFNLTEDGVVGKATWYKISYIYVAVTKLAELTSEGIQSVPIPASPPTTVVRLGNTGEFVTLAQYMLTTAARFYEDLYPLTIDGSFGTRTQEAVYRFQALFSLTQDGIVGRDTWQALYEVFYGVFESITPSNIPYPGTALRVGSTGNNVALMQRKLNVIAQFFPSIRRLTIDGRFGTATQAAVRTFQTLFGLTVDGVIGMNTWTRIVYVYDTLVG